MMIKPNASPDEYFSPFFKKNKLFCEEFEQFIAKHKGEVKGKFNAQSYLITGRISQPKNWVLTYKKSIFSSTGNLLLSSKKQSLYVIAEWKTNRIASPDTEFIIKKKSFLDKIKMILYNKKQLLLINKNYLIESKYPSSELIKRLSVILEELFISKEVYQIRLKNDELLIFLHTEKHHFDLFTKITLL